MSLEEQNNGALNPTVHRLLAEHNLDAGAAKDTGMGGCLTHEDVKEHLAKAPARESVSAAAVPVTQPALVARNEERVPMTHLHKRATECLLEAKNSIAMLTTPNEVNMKPIMDLRKQCGEMSEKRYDTRLGFMSFCVKAVAEALKRYSEVNVSIDGDDVVYHNYFDVSMVVSTPHGLMTPTLRDADALDMADIEKKIKELVVKGRGGKLTAEDLTGGNFTVTNGGVFGPLMSTPVINPPQSATLSTHAIKGRPMTVNGQVEILPMMCLTLSYDHRLIDGRESMGFLVTIKELLEDPMRLLLDMQQFKFYLYCRPDKALSPSSAIEA